MNEALKEIQRVQVELLSQASFDHLSFACIDFKNKKTHSWNLENNRLCTKPKIFDLASLTKPLLLAQFFLKNTDLFDDGKRALLEHRVDIPAYGILPKKNWKSIIENYPLTILGGGKTRYSDYSSLRLMLELGQDELYSFYLSELRDKHDLYFWKELTDELVLDCAPTGFRNKQEIRSQVHDPNAYNLDEFVSHAGLFGNIESLCRCLLSMNDQYDLLKRQLVRSDSLHSYFEGWDGVQNNETTLAGKSERDENLNTFGFLGFTGTSIWINPELQTGWVLLTNATQNYWHDRSVLNEIRRRTGQLVWPLFR